MPTLIRLFIALVVLAGLGLAGMFALTVMVDPGEKDITIKIPPRDLVAAPPGDILGPDGLPPPVNIAPKGASSAPAITIDTSDSGASQPGVTIETPGAPE